jgi:hypothetical protein
MRFQALIIATATVSLTRSSSENRRAPLHTHHPARGFATPITGLGPGQRRALAIGVERGLAPSVEQIEPLLALAFRASVPGMHMQAIGAAVDRRRARQLDSPGALPEAA